MNVLDNRESLALSVLTPFNLFIFVSERSIEWKLNLSRTRSLLVHKILIELKFEHEINDKCISLMKFLADDMDDVDLKNSLKKKFVKAQDKLNKDSENKIGLQFMLNKGYFENAFVLHDESTCDIHEKDLLRYSKTMDDLIAISTCQDTYSILKKKDLRLDLHEHWAKFKNTFKFQPFNLINDYFGERIELYFTWVGAFITTLWIPSFIGLIFFSIGFGYSYFNFNIFKL